MKFITTNKRYDNNTNNGNDYYDQDTILLLNTVFFFFPFQETVSKYALVILTIELLFLGEKKTKNLTTVNKINIK